MFAYSPFIHRHSIEIKEKCEFFGRKITESSTKKDLRALDSAIKINFVPHLSPFTRGMLVSIFARLKEPLNPLEILRECYKDEPFIRISENPVSVKNTAGSHFCDIFALCDGCDLFISSSIDNLLRGASSAGISKCESCLWIGRNSRSAKCRLYAVNLNYKFLGQILRLESTKSWGQIFGI